MRAEIWHPSTTLLERQSRKGREANSISCCQQTQGDGPGGLGRASSLTFSCTLWLDNRAKGEGKDSD